MSPPIVNPYNLGRQVLGQPLPIPLLQHSEKDCGFLPGRFSWGILIYGCSIMSYQVNLNVIEFPDGISLY